MTVLYLVRHGETVWNIQTKMQGWGDSPLTMKGVKEAKLLCDRLKDVKFDKIYSSPSGRAIETARFVKGKRNMEIIPDDNIREMNFGEWDGKKEEDVENNRVYTEQYHNFRKHPEIFKSFSGECYKDVRKRAVDEINKIVKENTGKRILIVTHSVALKCIMSYFGNIPISEMPQMPSIVQTSLSILKFNDVGKAKIVMYADDSHLKEGLDVDKKIV